MQKSRSISRLLSLPRNNAKCVFPLDDPAIHQKDGTARDGWLEMEARVKPGHDEE
jgi:hypothetical protein